MNQFRLLDESDLNYQSAIKAAALARKRNDEIRSTVAGFITEVGKEIFIVIKAFGDAGQFPGINTFYHDKWHFTETNYQSIARLKR